MVPLLPELTLRLAPDDADPFALWTRTATARTPTARTGTGTGVSGPDPTGPDPTGPDLEPLPPFWAYAWAGGQAVARYVLDHPALVAGRHVLDVAAGCGVVGIAAALAGAKSVTAVDVDPFAIAATSLNAAANGVRVTVRLADALDAGTGDVPAEVVLAGDVFYDRGFAARVSPFLHRAATRPGATVVVGDPGRRYFPTDGYRALARYEVTVSRAIEAAGLLPTTVWRHAGS